MSESASRWLALTSSVGRRILLAFIIATIVPATTIALLTNYASLKDNEAEIAAQLEQDSRSLGLILLSQIKSSGEMLSKLAYDLSVTEASDLPDGKGISPFFTALELRSLPLAEDSEKVRILIEGMETTDDPVVSIAAPVVTGQSGTTSHLVGRLSPQYLWNMGDLVGNHEGSCVFLSSGKPLFCTNGNVPPIGAYARAYDSNSSGTFRWNTENSAWQTGYWELFLTSQFDAEPWIITQTRRDDSRGLLGILSGSYFLSILFILVLSPFLVATIQIRKIMEPIDRLMAGVKRISRNDHSGNIEETGPTEFALLARSINTMSTRIGDQINTLHAFAEIDRVLLAKKNLASVCQLLIRLLIGVRENSQAMVVLLGSDSPPKAMLYTNTPGTTIIGRYEAELTKSEIATLASIDHPESISIECLPTGILDKLGSHENLFLYPVALNKVNRALLITSARLDDSDSLIRELLEGSLERLALALETIDRDHQLEFHASRDGLTKLANKRLLSERLNKALRHRDPGMTDGALLYIDLDFFKSVNDIAGHIAGDQVLEIVGQRIKHIFSSGTTVARIGGDEFAVFLPDTKNQSRVAEAADEIIHALSRPVFLSGVEHQLGASIGIARIPKDGDDLDELLFKADLAMYEAKNAGRNTWKYYLPKMKETVQARVSFESELRKAIEREELKLHIQPQMCIQTGKVTSGEALVRWFHEDLGPISPAEFIPVAEDTGLIVPLGEWVFDQCAKLLNSWKARELPIEKLSLNVSLRQFMHRDFKSVVEHALAYSGENSTGLEIEITESMFANDTGRAIEICEWIRNKGLSIAIDDFGTGYSSLGYLQSLPFDTLKIDRMFVEKIDSDPPDTGIVEVILGLAKQMSKTVVAEGVATTAQLRFLQERHCQLMQGFLLAKPAPPEEFVTYLRDTPMVSHADKPSALLRIFDNPETSTPSEADADSTPETVGY